MEREARSQRVRPSVPRGDLAVPVVLLGLLTAIWVLLVRADPYVGHDESVYANRARSLVTDLPAAGWQVSRPPALPVLAAPVVAAGGGLTALRLLGLALTMAALVVTWLVARRLSGPVTAALAVLTVLAVPGFVRRVPELLTDIPAAGLLMAVTGLLVARRRGATPWCVPAAALLAAVAFQLRYGVISSLGMIGLAAVLVYGPRVWWQDRRWVGLALAIWLAGFVPHLLWSRAVTGSPLGALELANASADYGAPGSGLVDYVTGFAGPIAGRIGAAVMLLGLARAALLAVRRLRGGPRSGDPRTGDERWVVLLALAAVLQVVALGIPSHAEPRFVFYAMLALAVAGAHTAVRLAGRLGRRQRLALGLLAVILLAGVAAGTVRTERSLAGASVEREVVAAAGRAIGTAAPGRPPCLVVSEERPELGWYTGCADAPVQLRLPAVPAGAAVHVVVFSGGEAPAPGLAAALDRLAAARATGPVAIRTVPGRGRLGDARISSVPAAR